MEDSFIVHRRRKAAARNREKTPEPPRFEQDFSDDDDARTKMERMVMDTEKMQDSTEEKTDSVPPGEPDATTSSNIAKPPDGEKVKEATTEPEVIAPKTSSLDVDAATKNKRSTDNAVLSRDFDAKEAKVTRSEETAPVDQEDVKHAPIPVDDAPVAFPSPEKPDDAVNMAGTGREPRIVESQNGETRAKKRSKDRAAERRNFTTDSSDGEEAAMRTLRRKKSPEGPRMKSGSARKSSSKSKLPTDTDDDVNTSKNESHSEKSKSGREKRQHSKHRPSTGTEDESSPRRNDSFTEKSKGNQEQRGGSRSRYTTDTDEDLQVKRREEKFKLSEKRSTSRSRRSGDGENDPRMTKSETFPQRSGERQIIKRSASEMKKQIIPLSDDSLIQDFAKAQQDYLKRERGILDPDPSDGGHSNSESKPVRRRKVSIIHTEPEREEIMKTVTQKKSWFSWLSFFRKKEKVDEPSAYVKPLEEDEKLRGSQVARLNTAEKVPFMEFLGALREIVSEFKAFVEQNPREAQIIRKLRNTCFAELLLIIIYCGLGAFVFRFVEGTFETFYKCGVKRVKRDFLDSLWNYSHNMREDDWKSMARRKLMEFEEQLHTAHEAGVHSYSGQKSWTFLNAVVYCLTVITTIGYGHISPSTTLGRAITIVYAIFGIPMFLIILADFGKLFTRGIKFLWAFVRRVYYTGSCRKVRRTAPVQEVMKGVQLVYDLATFRRPSQMNPQDIEELQKQQNQTQTVLNLDSNMPQPDTPGTPAMSTFAIDDEFNLPISVAIFILLVYIFVGAALYHIWESWTFLESVYFVFISMSTIGFGDYVPKHPIFMMCSIVYLVFGLALTSMCINVVQVMLSDSFKQASQKIGATIGFEVVEEDGTVQPAVPPAIELADVHTTIKESDSNEKLNIEKVAPKAKQEDVDV